MARDYKQSRRGKARRQPMPGWMWMLYGLGIGLSVALAVYLNDRTPGGVSPAETPARPLAERKPKSEAVEEQQTADRFDFYEMLPRFEVVIPELERGAPTPRDKPVEMPGSYILQAGSFKNFADADRMKARLALLGVEAEIQRVTIDDNTWHRVRVGPMDDLDRVNGLRSKLRQSEIDAFVVRLNE